MRSRPYIAVALVLTMGLLMGAGCPRSSNVPTVTLQPESRLWIEGSSTVNTFTCTAGEMVGQGQLQGRTRQIAAAPDEGAQGTMAVLIQGFDCGKKRMNQDLYDALQAQEHPTIRYKLEQIQLLPSVGAPEARLQTKGTLTIAGTTRPVEMTVTGRQLPDGRFQASGELPLRMTDFEVEPPTAMFGLVRAHDRIVVHFELIAAAEDHPAYHTD